IAFNDTPQIHYHFGVITNNLGANLVPGACAQPGDNARLQPIGAGALDTSPGAPFFDPTCMAPVGAPFLDFDAEGNNNLPPGQDLEKTLGCMLSVGTNGCGLEMPLEALYRTLHNPEPNFLRPEAGLLAIFFTDEDDCSAPPTSDAFRPETGDGFGPLASF